jgi:pimeloyl-ACP methyl ester carboxylesterase
LGADKRVFDSLDLNDYIIHHVEWIKPFPKESMGEYAQRLLPQIKSVNPILMGVSFGGMIALEIAKLIPTQKIILISSARSPSAIPSYFKLMGRLRIQKLMPPRAIKKPNEMLYWLFGVSTPEHRALLASIMADTDEIFFSWAIEAIANWDNKGVTSEIVQIHGTKDRILSPQKADYTITGGGHLMVVTRAAEINAIIKQVLS